MKQAGYSVLFYPKKEVVKANGTSPVYVRITNNGERATFSAKVDVIAASWDKTKQECSGRSVEICSINETLLAIKNLITNIKNDLIKEKGSFTSAEIRDIFQGLTQTEEEKEAARLKEEKRLQEEREKELEEQQCKECEELGIPLLDYFNNYLAERYKEVQAGTLGEITYSRYEDCRDRLCLYMLDNYGDWLVPLKYVDYHFVKGFETFLFSFGIGNNTVMKIMQKLDTVTTLAFSTGVISHCPFALFKYHKEDTHRDVLDDDELDRMYHFEFDNQTLEEVRDCYIFSCYTGLSYIDADTLDIDEIKKFFDGNDWIFKDRTKTGVESKILLLDIPRAILKKYEGKLAEGQLLPTISNSNTNKYLKIVAAMLKIDKKLTFHTARHTFATTVCLNNGVPLETVQKILGHKSIRTTQIYAKILDGKLMDDMNALASRLKKKQEPYKLNKRIALSEKVETKNTNLDDLARLAEILKGKHNDSELQEIAAIMQRIAG